LVQVDREHDFGVDVTIPAWDDTSVRRGTKVRIALWLLSEIGEGNTFTKARLREVFPGKEQADRRMRELRDHRWVIDTSAEDPALETNELRFVKAGDEVWKPGKASLPRNTLTAKERSAIMARDDYMCVVCGITGGESYPDAPHQTAQLAVSRREGGPDQVRYVTECKRCRAGASSGTASSVEDLLATINNLVEDDRKVLASWIKAGRRTTSAVERLWSGYRRLSAEERDVFASRLRGQA
jgi:hypothetical protein